MTKFPILAALLLTATVCTARAEDAAHAHGHDMNAMPGMGAPKAGDTPATREFREADARMHRAMDIRYANDVDLDFVRGMLPHHRGAVDMARVALKHSKDPEIRRLAEEIVRAQEIEIAQMQAFLKRREATR